MGRGPQLLPSITTAGNTKDACWSQIKEINTLKISEAALFLTGFDTELRKKLYKTLLKAKKKHPFTLPFIHARSDMSPDEYTFLIKEFGTKSFNLHPTRQCPLLHKLPYRLRRRIYIENTDSLLNEDLDGFAGVCLDVSHLEDYRLMNRHRMHNKVRDLSRKLVVGVSHISAITAKPYIFKNGDITYAPHLATSIADFAYLLRYPVALLGKYAALELENPLWEQLEIKEHIDQLIDARRSSPFPAPLPSFFVGERELVT